MNNWHLRFYGNSGSSINFQDTLKSCYMFLYAASMTAWHQKPKISDTYISDIEFRTERRILNKNSEKYVELKIWDKIIWKIFRNSCSSEIQIVRNFRFLMHSRGKKNSATEDGLAIYQHMIILNSKCLNDFWLFYKLVENNS